MTSAVLDVPAMYADHHVVEVRRLLLGLPGVNAVYASSAFHQVEIDFDPDITKAEALEEHLAAAGYLTPLPVPAETGESSGGREAPPFRRLTVTHPAAGAGIGFRRDYEEPGEDPKEQSDQ